MIRRIYEPQVGSPGEEPVLRFQIIHVFVVWDTPFHRSLSFLLPCRDLNPPRLSVVWRHREFPVRLVTLTTVWSVTCKKKTIILFQNGNLLL